MYFGGCVHHALTAASSIPPSLSISLHLQSPPPPPLAPTKVAPPLNPSQSNGRVREFHGKLASSELFTILGGFTSSILFLVLLTFIGNFQESCGVRTGWGAVILAEAVALIAAGTVHRVCITTCFLFSAALLYEVNKISGSALSRSESKTRRH
ncbi:hypothetical protein NL676_012525 [Syzygium grande]|nr:hypothetical protein NL676_012525 [Syzygium grande]